MSFRKYEIYERRRMAEIYADEGGAGYAIPRAIERIKDEMGIVLPKDGRSLRTWLSEFKLTKPIKRAELVLFPQAAPPISVPDTMLSFEQFQEITQRFAGADYAQDRALLNAVNEELTGGRIKESLKTKSPEDLLKLKQMIEETQQKRESHLIKLTQYVDFRKQNKRKDQTDIDDLILEEIEHAETQKAAS